MTVACRYSALRVLIFVGHSLARAQVLITTCSDRANSTGFQKMEISYERVCILSFRFKM